MRANRGVLRIRSCPACGGPYVKWDDAPQAWLCDECGAMFELDPQGFLRRRRDT